MKAKKPQKNVGPIKQPPYIPLKKLAGVKTYQQIPKDMPPMALEKVIGMSSRSINSLTINPLTGDVAYPAGCIVVIYSPKENKQTRFLTSRSARSFSCLAYSHNGRYFAAGEGAFRQPEITIWEIGLDGNYEEIKHLKGHKYGIESVMFSPNLEYLVSLGDNNDRGLFVWDWNNEQRVTSNKLGKPVNTMSFAESGEYFVTAGYQHLKFWFFDENGRIQKTDTNSKEAIMESKSADLTKVKLKVFVGVCCKQGQIFALAQDGHLYIFDRLRKLQKWMNIKVQKALSCTMTNEYLFCGCSDGIIRVFAPRTLDHIITLPKPPPLGTANIEAGVKTIRIPAQPDSKFADTMAVIVDEPNQRVVALYSDRMVFMWDIKNLQKISVYRTFLYHCGPIHDIQYIPNSVKVGFKESDTNLDSETGLTKFVTCSSDTTIRFWHFVDPSLPQTKMNELSGNLQRNAYCKDMSRMIYVNSEPADGRGQFDNFKIKPSPINEDGSSASETVAPEDRALDMEQLLRCIKCSPDWKHIASGDWTGNIRIHDLTTFEEVDCIQAHENEVVCLDYSPIIEYTLPNKEGTHHKYLLASGSRDRLTQVFDVTDGNYENIAILDDHSSTITAVKFAEEKISPGLSRFKLLSGGADKQMVYRVLDKDIITHKTAKKLSSMPSDDSMPVVKKEQCKHKIFTMDVSTSSQYLISGHDKLLQLWHLPSADKVWEKKPESVRKSGSQDQIRVHIDSCAAIVVASSTDKQVTIYEAASGNVVCRTSCGEITTAMCLSSNLRHLITASADGIIYVWKLPELVTKALLKIKQEHKQREQQEEVKQEEDFNKLDDDEWKDLGHETIAMATNDQQNDTAPSLVQPKQLSESGDSPKKEHEKLDVASILLQINKATDQIDKIQPRQKAVSKDQEYGEEEQPSEAGREPSEESKGRNISGRRRKDWANAQKEDPAFAIEDVKNKALEVPAGEKMRELNVRNSQLPRWAQSVADLKAMEKSNHRPQEPSIVKQKKEEIKEASSSETEDLEDIFQSTLAKQEAKLATDFQILKNSSAQQTLNKGQDSSAFQGGVPLNNFYENLEEEDKHGVTDEDDDEEAKIKAQMKKNKLKKLYGFMEGDDADQNQEDLQRQKKLNENRTSISQQFFKRRVNQSQDQNSLMNSVQKSSNIIGADIKVEDIPTEPSLNTKQANALEDQAKLSPHPELAGVPVKKVQDDYKAKLSEEQKSSELDQIQKRLKIEQEIHEKQRKIEVELAEQQRKKTEESEKKKLLSEEKKKAKERQKIQMLNSDEEDFQPEKSDPPSKGKDKSPVPSRQTPQNNSAQSMARYERSYTTEELDESSYVQMESASTGNKGIDDAAVNSVIKTEIDKINDSLSKINQTLNSVKQDTRQSIKVKDDVGDSLNRSLSLFNSLIFALNQRTSYSPNMGQGPVSISGNSLFQSQGSSLSQISIKDDARDLLQKYSDMLVEEISKKLGAQVKK